LPFVPAEYENHTLSKATRPWAASGPVAFSGPTTSAFASRRPKMRSEAAIAAWRMLNFSDRSEIGRQNRSEYWMNARVREGERAGEDLSAP